MVEGEGVAELDSSSARVGCAVSRETGAVPEGKMKTRRSGGGVYMQKTGKTGHFLNAKGKNPIERS